jgi:hypothetical protein
VRKFEDNEATRERVPLLVGVYGPSGTGKTFSALRLATGMQRVVGGDVHVVDTEARRALHYADRFTFRHVPFAPPFDPESYMAALEHCARRGARVVVVDNMSHEHEGQGGVLEMQASEEERLSKLWNTTRDKAKMSAWQVPKTARRRLIHAILQMGLNAVICFRAKEKMRVISGRQPEPLGWMPIAGDEFIFEMTATALLLPGASGVPTWNPQEPGERAMVKRPAQFEDVLRRFEGKPLCEEIGEAMAQWAAGDVSSDAAKGLRSLLESAATLDALVAAWSNVDAAAKAKAITTAERRELITLKESGPPACERCAECDRATLTLSSNRR